MASHNSLLALKGGRPAVPEALGKEHHPQLSERMRQLVLSQLTDQISIYDNGGIYERLESALKEKWNLPSALTVNSGTTALYTMFYGAGLVPGDEVIVPSYTFFATATPLFPLGVRPVLADCLDNGNIDPDSVAALVSVRTKAVVCTHMWGIPCDMDELQAVASKAKILLLEDSSHAHGALYRGKVVGSFADGSAWSLQGKKLLTAGEGGLYSTRHKEHYERAILIGHFNKRAKKEVYSSKFLPFTTTGTGLNFRMHPLGAALAYSQIETFDEQLSQRRQIAQVLTYELSKIDGLRVPHIPAGAEPAWYAFPILYNAAAFPGVSKEVFVRAVHAEGAVEVDIPGSTCPLSKHPLFRTPGDFLRDSGSGTLEMCAIANAERYHGAVIKLPCFHGALRYEQAQAYVAAISKVAASRGELAE